jgi:hypothetical protein
VPRQSRGCDSGPRPGWRDCENAAWSDLHEFAVGPVDCQPTRRCRAAGDGRGPARQSRHPCDRVTLTVVRDCGPLSATNGCIVHPVAGAVEGNDPRGCELDLNGVSAAIHRERPAGIAERDGVATAVDRRITAGTVGGDGRATLRDSRTLRVHCPDRKTTKGE